MYQSSPLCRKARTQQGTDTVDFFSPIMDYVCHVDSRRFVPVSFRTDDFFLMFTFLLLSERPPVCALPLGLAFLSPPPCAFASTHSHARLNVDHCTTRFHIFHVSGNFGKISLSIDRARRGLLCQRRELGLRESHHLPGRDTKQQQPWRRMIRSEVARVSLLRSSTHTAPAARQCL